jgi:hypothetical protein
MRKPELCPEIFYFSGLATLMPRFSFAKIRSCGMVTQSPIEKSPGAEGEERTKNFLPGGQRNALKRFKTDKRIQGNPSPFL